MSTIALRVSVPVVAAAALLAAVWLARSPEPEPPLKTDTPDIVCIEPTAEPTPSADVYDKLAVCLEQWNAHRPVGAKAVSVADVRYWVEVEHDPVWLEGGSWWLPLSGEGDEHFPSGLYISVPLQGSVRGGAIVN
jgi:hypothetical protein